MKLISYNVNGLRAAMKKGLLEWMQEEDPDIICFQETKSNFDQIPEDTFKSLGYHESWFSAEKKGYSGVMTLSKKKPTRVIKGMGMSKYDNEGRVVRTDFGALTILNCYFPSGSSSEERHAFKVDFLNDFGPWVKSLLSERKKVIVVGDYNVVHLDIDIHNPQRKDKPSGFRPEERAWMNEWFSGDFKDAFRLIKPDEADNYSWWSYRAGSRQRNKGWRIDYISVTNNLAKKVNQVTHDKEVQHSDHAAVIMDIAL